MLRECGLTPPEVERYRANTTELGNLVRSKYEKEKKNLLESWEAEKNTTLKLWEDKALIITNKYEDSISELKKETQSTHDENTRLAHELQKEQEKNRALLASKSWRLTAPYRYVGHQGRRVVHVTRAFPEIVRRAGGWSAISSKALATLKDEGISSYKQL